MNDLGALPVLPVAGKVIVDHDVTSRIAQPGEPAIESGHIPELILTPALIGMVVALGTVETTPKEHPNLLRHSVLEPRHLAADREVVPSRATVTLSSDTLPSNLVVKFVLRHTLPDPFPIDLGILGG